MSASDARAWRPFDYAPARIDASGAVRIAEFHSAGARVFPAHAHESLMVTFLLAGSYRERSAAGALDHGPFSLACHPPGFEHEDAFGATGARLLVVELAREAAYAAVPELSEREPRRVESTVALACALHLRSELMAGGAACASTLEGCVLDLLIEATRETRAAAVARPRWLRVVVERLRERFRDPVSLAELATEAGVHLGHLWRVFRRCEGCSPTTYVQRLRCREVLRSLGGLGGPGRGAVRASLAEVALAAGFSDQSHCNRVFRRVMGSPPGVLRRALAVAPPPTVRAARRSAPLPRRAAVPSTPGAASTARPDAAAWAAMGEAGDRSR